jgi:hypothetical protein
MIMSVIIIVIDWPMMILFLMQELSNSLIFFFMDKSGLEGQKQLWRDRHKMVTETRSLNSTLQADPFPFSWSIYDACLNLKSWCHISRSLWVKISVLQLFCTVRILPVWIIHIVIIRTSACLLWQSEFVVSVSPASVHSTNCSTFVNRTIIRVYGL